MGEKLRRGRKSDPIEAFSKPGRYTTVKNGLEIKDIILDSDSKTRPRYLLVRHLLEAKRDAPQREDIATETKSRLEELKQLDGKAYGKAAGSLKVHKVRGRYISQTKTGKLRLDTAKIKNKAQYDGEYLISTSDLGLCGRRLHGSSKV